MFVFGEDIPNVDLSNLEFLAVQDLYLTPTAQKANVVIPAVSYAESKGTMTNAERRIQRTYTAIPPLTGYANWQVINEMMYMLGWTKNYKKVEEITEELSKAVPEYLGLVKVEDSSFWPVNGPEVLYTNGFNFPDKMARLALVLRGPLFNKRESTDFVEKEFSKVVQEI